MEEFICKYCGKICKNLNSLRQHEIRCKMNPNKIDISKSLEGVYKYNHSNNHIKTNQYIKAKELGLPKPIISDETRIKLGNANKGKKRAKAIKDKISLIMQNVVKKYPDSYNGCNKNGRVPVIDYNGIKLNGSWEVKVAQYLDKNAIKWIRPKKGIEYIFEGKTHLYYPDFYLIDYDYYIEVKGYETKKI